MASDASVPNNFVTGTPAVADDVDANFAALVSWVNTNAVHLDGSKAFTSVPSGPASDPTSDNQLARKAYVDGKVPTGTRLNVKVTRAAATSISGLSASTVTFTAEAADNGGFIATPASTFTVPSGGDGLYAYGARFSVDFSGAHQLRLTVNSVQVAADVGVTSSGGHLIPTGIVALAAGDTFSVAVYNASGSTISMTNMTFYMVKISD